MNASLALALALLARHQAGDAPRPANPILDGVAVQAGDALVPLSELERVLKRYQSQNPPGSRAEDERQRVLILQDLLTARLEEQSGADLGLDVEQVGRINRAS